MNEEIKDSVIADDDLESYLKRASLTCGIISLIFGVISIILAVFSLASWGGIASVLGIIGIILGAVGVKAQKYGGFATAGLACSCVGAALGITGCFACAVAVPAFFEYDW